MAQNAKLRRCALHEGSVLRLVSPRLQSLQEICYSKIRKMIVNSCRERLDEIFNFDENKRAMRQFFSQLPVTVREQILEKVSTKYIHGNYPLDLYLYEVLFSTGMKKLMFFVRCDSKQNHIDCFFNLMSVEGKELRTLEFLCPLGDPTQLNVTPKIYEQLTRTLFSAEHLVDLQLDFLCDDTIMKTIGENCTLLRNLDVVNSNITYKGVHYVTQNFVRRPAETEEEQRVWQSTIFNVPGIFPQLVELLPEGEPVKFYERKKSPLCSTLKRFNIIIDEEFDFQARLAIIELIPNLESFGYKGTFSFLYDLWFRWYKLHKANDSFVPHPLNLTSVDVHVMFESIFGMVIKICPKLRRIHYDYFVPDTPSTFSLSSFNHFGYLEFMDVRHTKCLQCECLRELSEEIREKLTEVTIEDLDAAKPFDICGAQQCSSLRRLVLRFPTIFWKGTPNGDVLPQNDAMQNLSFVNLQGKVTGRAVLSLLECAPNLEYLTVSDIIEREEDFLLRVLGMREMPRLETFEVLEGFLLDTEDELRSFVNHFERIQHVGKIRFLSN